MTKRRSESPIGFKSMTSETLPSVREVMASVPLYFLMPRKNAGETVSEEGVNAIVRSA